MKPIYQVRVVDYQGRDRIFRCIWSARGWMVKESARPQEIWVRDEVSGREIPARAAYYVRNPAAADRLQAFRKKSQAEAHAAQVQGMVLAAAEAPFTLRAWDQKTG